jgi:hypothetical protein
MLPMTLQFLIVRIATAIDNRLQRKLDYVEGERSARQGRLPVAPRWDAELLLKSLPRNYGQTLPPLEVPGKLVKAIQSA